MPSLETEARAQDALFQLMARYKADTHQPKVDLGVGAYRSNEGQPWVLPIVQKVDKILVEDKSVNHEYLPIGGNQEFVKAAAKLILGDVDPDRVASVQTLSGTGANHMGALLLHRIGVFGNKKPKIWVSDPTWANHLVIFNAIGLQVEKYPYWSAEKRSLDFDGLIKALNTATKGDMVLLHACAHNPTGVDPTEEQWREIGKLIKKKELFAFFDSAYQGFASGDLDRDAFAIRHFIKENIDLLVCQSFAKNMGLYGERVGALHVVLGESSPELVKALRTQLEFQTRAEFSNCPGYGARIATKILTNKDLFEEWKRDIKTMSQRILKMRAQLRKELEDAGAPGTWDHITSQIGMFSFTGLGAAQVQQLEEEFHIYLSRNGRISVAGLNEQNAQYVGRSIKQVLSKSRL